MRAVAIVRRAMLATPEVGAKMDAETFRADRIEPRAITIGARYRRIASCPMMVSEPASAISVNAWASGV
jgi:hypothetical protein